MCCTRPNLSYVVSAVSRFIHNPGKDHWDTEKWILHYVKGSPDKGLAFDMPESITFNVVGNIDSDNIDDFDRRHPISSYVHTLYASDIS